jgi:5-methylthioadenosine/S-adenosylhomocysteine deaminase
LSTRLVHGGVIVTNDARGRIIDGGAIYTEDDRIVKVGKSEDLLKQYPTAEFKDNAAGKVVIPGLVQAHTHVMGHLFKGFSEENEQIFYGKDLPMERFIEEPDAYWLSLIGAIEALKFGTVLINDIFHYSTQTARAVRNLGMRAVIEHKVFDVKALANIQRMDYSRDYEAGEKRLKENERLIKEWNGGASGRITTWVGNHAPDTNSPELLKAGRKLADKYRVGIHIHVAQSKREVRYVERQYGKTSVEFLNDLGFLRKDVVCAHLVFATKSDIRILERTQAKMVHCPGVMGKFAAYPPIKEFLGSKVKMGMGSDWISLNPWVDMRTGIRIARVVTGDPGVLDPYMVFRLMTRGSAEVLRQGRDLGSLEAGKKADYVVIDRKRANLTPMRDVVPGLVYNMTGSEVEEVLVDGKPVVEKGKVTLVDEDEAVAKAQQVSEAIWERGGVPPQERIYYATG